MFDYQLIVKFFDSCARSCWSRWRIVLCIELCFTPELHRQWTSSAVADRPRDAAMRTAQPHELPEWLACSAVT